MDKVHEEYNQLCILLNSTVSRFRSNKLSDLPHNWTNFWVTLHRVMPYSFGHFDAVIIPLAIVIIIIRAIV